MKKKKKKERKTHKKHHALWCTSGSSFGSSHSDQTAAVGNGAKRRRWKKKKKKIPLEREIGSQYCCCIQNMTWFREQTRSLYLMRDQCSDDERQEAALKDVSCFLSEFLVLLPVRLKTNTNKNNNWWFSLFLASFFLNKRVMTWKTRFFFLQNSFPLLLGFDSRAADPTWIWVALGSCWSRPPTNQPAAECLH